jgi:hypothetical protein
MRLSKAVASVCRGRELYVAPRDGAMGCAARVMMRWRVAEECAQNMQKDKQNSLQDDEGDAIEVQYLGDGQ